MGTFVNKKITVNKMFSEIYKKLQTFAYLKKSCIEFIQDVHKQSKVLTFLFCLYNCWLCWYEYAQCPGALCTFIYSETLRTGGRGSLNH
jgi:hypothetical protein